MYSLNYMLKDMQSSRRAPDQYLVRQAGAIQHLPCLTLSKNLKPWSYSGAQWGFNLVMVALGVHHNGSPVGPDCSPDSGCTSMVSNANLLWSLVQIFSAPACLRLYGNLSSKYTRACNMFSAQSIASTMRISNLKLAGGHISFYVFCDLLQHQETGSSITDS